MGHTSIREPLAGRSAIAVVEPAVLPFEMPGAATINSPGTGRIQSPRADRDSTSSHGVGTADMTALADADPLCGTEALTRPAGEAAAVAALDYAHRQKRAYEVAELIAILHTADLWKMDDEVVFEGMERLITPGHDGTPSVGEFVALELGPLLQVTPKSALDQIGFALDLRHRHPHMFRRVIAGNLHIWKAKEVVKCCWVLPLDVCLEVDEKVAPIFEYHTTAKAMRLLEEHIIAADVETARKRAEAQRLQRFIKISAVDDGHVKIFGIVNPEDGLLFDFILKKIATTLPEHPDPLIGNDFDQRRARALGILCRQYQQPGADPAVVVTHGPPAPDEPPEPEPPEFGTCWHTIFDESAGDSAPASAQPAPTPERGVSSREPNDQRPAWRRKLDAVFRDDSAQNTNKGADPAKPARPTAPPHRQPAPSDRSQDQESTWRERRGAIFGNSPAHDEGSSASPPPDDPDYWGPPDPPEFLTTPAPVSSEGGTAHRSGNSPQVPADPSMPASASARPHPWQDTTMPTHTLVVHINACDLAPGTARVDGWGPLLTEQLPEFLKDSKVVVRPILDPEQISPSDAYQVPGRMRFAIEQRNLIEVFPYGTLPSSRCDMDHTVPFQRGPNAPAGQTNLGNLGPLSRKAHRAKTSGSCHLEQPSPGVFIWTTKHGYQYAITAAGTTRIQAP